MSVRATKQINNPAKKNDQKDASKDTQKQYMDEANRTNISGYAATAAFAAVLIGILGTGNQFEGVVLETFHPSSLAVPFLIRGICRGTEMVHVDREPESNWWRDFVS